jgi:hypothetical protein
MRILAFLTLVFYTHSQPAVAQSGSTAAPTEKGVTLNVQLSPAKPESHTFEIVKDVCDLLAALAWPALITGLLIASRKSFPKLLASFTDLIGRSDHVKIMDLIDIELKRVGQQAEEKGEASHDIPMEDREAAGRVGWLSSEVRLSDIQKRLSELADEYEETRANMSPGADRTRAMNAIVARMHTLAVLARPLLPLFATSDRPGKRLAAITILELNPSLDYVDWLVERMSKETPFLLFHASLALREIVYEYYDFAGPGLREAISRALEVLNKFERDSGQTADVNTRVVLQSAFSRLSEGANA